MKNGSKKLSGESSSSKTTGTRVNGTRNPGRSEPTAEAGRSKKAAPDVSAAKSPANNAVSPRTDGQMPPAAERLLKLANEAYAKGALPEAATALHQALHHAPHEVTLLVSLANIRFQLGQYPQALESYLAARELQPDAVDILVRLAMTAIRCDDIPTFEQALGRALHLEPKNSQALRLLANLNLQNRRYQDAAGQFQELLQQSPGDAGLLMCLGRCQFELQDWEAARRTYRTALQADPGLDVARENIVVIEQKMAKPTPAAAANAPQTPAAGKITADETILDQIRQKGIWREGCPLRLHLGCGENHFAGYANIDYPPSEHSVMTRFGADIFADITGLNFPAESVDEIRSHHVFEHFTRPQAMALLVRWQEWLKPGGKLHIETPDVMGCAEQLVSNASYRIKQAVLRHCFGSHEASWAVHDDGWHAEKFHQVLSRFGFATTCRRWRWEREPYLANVEVHAIKTRRFTRRELLAVVDSILEESMVVEVVSERKMWEVWRQETRKLLQDWDQNHTASATAPNQLAPQPPAASGACQTFMGSAGRERPSAASLDSTSAVNSTQSRAVSAGAEVVVKLQGGLGNQMFQFAAGLALARRHNSRLKLDLSFLRDRTPRPNFTQRDYCLDLFTLPAGCEVVADSSADAKRFRHHVEQQFHFDPKFFDLGPNVYLDGYFQSPRFFEPARDEVVRTFKSFATPLNPEQQAVAEKIKACQAVCLHVRRGDYVANPAARQFHGVCDESYYHAAVARIRKSAPNAHFFIFSDDIEWCRTSNLTGGAPFTLVTHEFAGDCFGADLQLMTACRYFILSNSSFGWWAAFLGAAPDKIVITPTPWFDNPAHNTMDLLPASWVRLPKTALVKKAEPAVARKPLANLTAPRKSKNISAGVPKSPATPPLVSVVIRCYKQAHFLFESVGSVVQQTYRDWEIIVVDDGSPDLTKQVFEVLSIRWSGHRLRFVGKKNGGLSDALNAGVAAASGRYILPLDADDMLHPEMIEKTVRLLESHPEIAIAYTDLVHFGSVNKVVRAAEFNPRLLPQNNQLNYCSLYRREVWSVVGGYNPNMTWGYEDWDFWVGCAERGLAAKRVPEPLLLYRVKETSTYTKALEHDRELRAQIILNHPSLYAPDTVLQARKLLESIGANNELLTLQSHEHTGSSPLVSVIIPTYNRPKHLMEAVQSILNQSVKNVEIIVVNDGGTEIQSQMRLIKTPERIVICNHSSHKGVSAARNSGIAAARGRYIAYLDDDDIFHPEHLQTLVNVLEENSNLWLAYSDAECAYQVPDASAPSGYRVVDRKLVYSKEFSRDELLVGNYIPICCVMHRRELLDVIGGFDESMPAHEDHDLFLRASRLTPFCHIRRVTCEYRQRSDVSNTTTARRRAFFEGVSRIYMKRSFLTEHNPAIRAAQERQLLWFFRQTLEVEGCSPQQATLEKMREARPDLHLNTISIIIPVHNHWDLTKQCLDNILKTQKDHSVEIIVVDSGSNDSTAAELKSLAAAHPQIRISSHRTNQPFACACNQGARVSQGRYLLFLNNDTVPHPGWLDALMKTICSDSRIGVAGNKLLYPDGTIQHAGIVVGERDGDPYPYHVYLCQKADAPFVNKVREFQMVTGACLMIRRDLFNQVGGFNEGYVNGHEDMDLCLKVRTAGFRVMYCPSSVVTHLESRTKRLIGLERFHYQKGVENEEGRGRRKFLKQWRQTLVIDDKTVYAEDGVQWQHRPAAIGATPVTSVKAPAKAISTSSPSSKPSRPLHILFTLYGWTEEGGGTILPRQIAKALVRRGHRLSVIYTPAKTLPGQPAYHVERHREDGVELIAIYNRPALFCDFEHPDREINDPQMRATVAGLVRELQPDLVHYHSLLNFSLGTVEAVGELGIPAVYTSHNYWPLCPRMYLFQKDLALCNGPSADGSRCATCIGATARQDDYARRAIRSREVFSRYVFRHLAVSNRVRELFIASGHAAERIAVLQQQPETVGGLWSQVGTKRKPGLSNPNHVLQIGFIGSLLPQKGIHVLTAAAQNFTSEQVQVHLFGAGPEPYVRQLEKMDGASVLQFHGGYRLEDLPRLLNQIDLVVVPSVWEDCAPLVVAEALAARCPVIGSRIGGIPDFIEDGKTGLLVPPNDPAALAKAIGRFVQEPPLLKQMQHNIEAPRGFDAYLGDLEEHYQEALAQIPEAIESTSAWNHVSQTISVSWEGSFLDYGSLSHVNRELTQCLSQSPNLRLSRVDARQLRHNAASAEKLKALSNEIVSVAPPDTQVTVRHSWPPNWTASHRGALVVIQPWEFGALPEEWVRQADRVQEFWVPSRHVQDVYVHSGVPAEKVKVVPNGIDPARFHPKVAPMKLATHKTFKFLFVGGTIGRKGPDVLLNAYLKSFSADDDVCLVIKDFGGDSCYRGQTMSEQIRAAQSQPNAPEILHLNEEFPPEALPGLYTACDCLVHPYRGEGFGLPILEAMACGLPVVVTAGGAADDFAGDQFAYRIPAQRTSIGNQVGNLKLAGAGWLLEPDVAALAERMKWMVTHQNAARVKSARAGEHVRQNWTWQRAAEIAAKRLEALVAAQHQTVTTTAGIKNQAARKPAAKTLPPVARLGNLDEARSLLGQRKFEAAWQKTASALAVRPFHPEAFLLLAGIAMAAGAGTEARQYAQYARELAPGWKSPKQFLKKKLKGNARPEWLKLPEPVHASKSKVQNLSVCLITKNEEKFLGQCLKSVRDFASQIVVVDTGSTDRTVEIAREHGAEVHDFQWCDDFSAARNECLKHARGDWILMLDADEEVASGHRQKLEKAMNEPAVVAWRLPIMNVGREQEGCAYVPRLFRNAPGAYYRGRIHEQIFPSLINLAKNYGLRSDLAEVQLLHHGYTAEVTKNRDKVARNLRLLQKAVEDYPEDANLAMNLGLERVRSGDLPAGLTHYREAFRLMSALKPDEVVPELREALLTQFTCHLCQVRAHDEIVQTLNSPLAKHGGLTASLHFALALAQFELHHFAEATEHMRQCLAKRGQPTYAPLNSDILTAAPHHCLALALARLGNPTEAENAFRAGLKEKGRVEELRLDYAKFLTGQNRPVEAFHQLHEIVRHKPQHSGAWRLGSEIALSKPEFLEFARDWTGEAVRHLPQDKTILFQRAEVLMLGGQTKSALDLWQRIFDLDRQPRALAALILCQTVESETACLSAEGFEEQAASRAFVQWYQKLVRLNAYAVVRRINEETNRLSRVLPTAARLLEAALNEAGACVTA